MSKFAVSVWRLFNLVTSSPKYNFDSLTLSAYDVIKFLQNPPNFLIMGDFRTYVTQEVVVPQEAEHDEEPVTEGNLIDTTDDGEVENHNSSQNNAPNIDMHLEIVQEREFLRSQCETLR